MFRSTSFFNALRFLVVVGALLLAACSPQMAAQFKDGQAEFTGVVASIGPTAWVIGDHTVPVNADTKIGPGIAVGMSVKVEVKVQSDGSVVAVEIKLADEGGDANETGTPEATESAEGKGTEVAGTPEADDQNECGDAGVSETDNQDEGEDSQVGGTSAVDQSDKCDDSQVAETPEADGHNGEDSQDNGADIKVTGTLTAISGNVWTVDGKAVTVTDATQVEGNPKIGDTVKVEGTRQADGSVLAKQIENKSSGGDGSDGGESHDSGEGGDD